MPTAVNGVTFLSGQAATDIQGCALLQALSALSELLTGTPYYEADTLYRYWEVQLLVQQGAQAGFALRRLHCSVEALLCKTCEIDTCQAKLAIRFGMCMKCWPVELYQLRPAVAQLAQFQLSYRGWHVRRAFNAVGTLSMANSESKQLAQDLGILQTGRDILRQPLEPKLLAVIQDLVTLLKP